MGAKSDGPLTSTRPGMMIQLKPGDESILGAAVRGCLASAIKEPESVGGVSEKVREHVIARLRYFAGVFK